jgi:hypothetical protein
LAAAAAVLVMVALPWRTSGTGLVEAMAAEHVEHVHGDHYTNMTLLSAEDSRIEAYLSRELGTKVQLPPRNVPKKRGACCGQHGDRKMGVVGCFCQRRGKAVTIFVFRAEGLSLRGLERVVRDGRTFHCGASGKCQAAIWHTGDLCYALVGQLERDDLRDMARRAAKTLDARTTSS